MLRFKMEFAQVVRKSTQNRLFRILMKQLDYKNIHLAIIAIEKGAKLMKVPPQNMYMRLKKQGLIHNFLLSYYDELHTQSAEWLAETTVETLKNWEEAQ